MKKLMIAMTAVASFALVAKSATTLGVDEDFSTRKLGPFINADTGKFPGDSDGSIRWETTEPSGSESAIEAGSDTDRYLHIEESGVLTREIGKATPIPANGHIDIDTTVQFTAIDWTNDNDNPKLDEGAKLALWLKKDANNSEAKPTLMVTHADAENRYAPTNVVTDATVVEGEWYDLKVASYLASDGTIEFTVSIDNVPVNGGKRFISLIQSGDNKGTIASVGFKGTGKVDNIAFSSDVDEQPVTRNIFLVDSVSGDDVFADTTMASINDGTPFEITTGTITYIASTTTKITISVVAEGYLDNTVVLTGETLPTGDITIQMTPSEGPTPVTPTVDLPANCSWVDGKAPLAEYEVGSTIDPNALAATTTTAHKKAVVTVKVNGSVITEEYTVQAGDEITITVTEEYITFTLTIPTVTGATADQTTGAVVEGTEVTINWTAEEGYKITAGATQTITVTEDTTAAEPTVVAIQYAEVTITPVDNCTITVVDAEGVAVATGTKFDVDDEVVLTVTRTPATDYELVDCEAEETVTMTENKTITATVKKTEVGPELPESVKGGSPEQKTAYADWATKNGIEDVKPEYADAFAINAAPAEAADKLATIITPEMVAEKIVALDLAADGASFKLDDYPNATFKFVKVETIETDAKLFKLQATFAPANAK